MAAADQIGEGSVFVDVVVKIQRRRVHLLLVSEHMPLSLIAPLRADLPIAVGSEEWDALTARRAVLIRKKDRDGLTADEADEFAALQSASRAATEAAFPKQHGQH